MNKKLLIALLSIFSIPFVLAQSLPAPPIALRDVGKFVTDIITGPTSGVDLFAKFLLLILLIVVLTKPAKLLVDNKTGLAVLIASIVSIIGVRFLTNEMLKGILLPYGTVAIVLASFIPFLLMVYFLNDVTIDWIRKVGWIMMAVIFTGLWWMRWTDIGNMAYAYLLVAIASFSLFWLDGTIQRWWSTMRITREKDRVLYQNIMKIQGELTDMTRWLANAPAGSREQRILNNDIRETQNKLRNLYRQLH